MTYMTNRHSRHYTFSVTNTKDEVPTFYSGSSGFGCLADVSDAYRFLHNEIQHPTEDEQMVLFLKADELSLALYDRLVKDRSHLLPIDDDNLVALIVPMIDDKVESGGKRIDFDMFHFLLNPFRLVCETSNTHGLLPEWVRSAPIAELKREWFARHFLTEKLGGLSLVNGWHQSNYSRFAMRGALMRIGTAEISAFINADQYYRARHPIIGDYHSYTVTKREVSSGTRLYTCNGAYLEYPREVALDAYDLVTALIKGNKPGEAVANTKFWKLV